MKLRFVYKHHKGALGAPRWLIFLRGWAHLLDALVCLAGFPFRYEGDATIILSEWRLKGSFAKIRRDMAAESHIWKYPTGAKK